MLLHRGVLLLGMLTAAQSAPQPPAPAPPPKAVEKKVVPARKTMGPPEVPAELKARPGQMIRVTVRTENEIGTLRNFTDEEAFWGELVSPKGTRQFVFQAPADGKRSTFVVGWWTKGETEGATTTISVEGVTPDPLPPPKKDPDPVDPPGGGPYYFMVVRPDGAAHPDYTRLMADPGWKTLRDKGHTVKEFTRSAAAKWTTPPESMPYSVTTLVVTRNAKGEPQSTIVRGSIVLPTATTDITKLPEVLP